MVRTPQSTLMIKCCVLVLSQQNKQLRNNMNGKILDLHIMRKWNHIQKGQTRHSKYNIMYTLLSCRRSLFAVFLSVELLVFALFVNARASSEQYRILSVYVTLSLQSDCWFAGPMNFSSIFSTPATQRKQRKKARKMFSHWFEIFWMKMSHITCLFAYYRVEDIKIWLKQTHQIDQFNFASFSFVIFYLYISFSFRTFLLCFKFLKPIGG